MKKMLSIGLVLLVCSLCLLSEETTQENPFDSFMGMKWGVTASDFKVNFKEKIYSFEDGFYFNNLKLGTITVEQIKFIFKNVGVVKDLKFKEKNYPNFAFDKVIMFTTPDQYDVLLQIFIKKYGEPIKSEENKIQNRMGAEFLQQISYWEKSDRAIILYKYMNRLDEGRAIFLSLSEMNKNNEKKAEANEEAANIL